MGERELEIITYIKVNMKKKIGVIFGILLLIGGILFYRSIYAHTGNNTESVSVVIAPGMTVRDVAHMLAEQQIIDSERMLVRYLVWKKLDTKIQHGTITFDPPHTIARIAARLSVSSAASEDEIRILPGWNLHDIAAYVEERGIASTQEFFDVVGTPASFSYADSIDFGTAQQPALLAGKPMGLSLEGYLRPDTFRIFPSSTVQDIVKKLLLARQDQFTVEMYQDIQRQRKNIHDILTMASILEREVRTPEDRRLVSDLFWRRYTVGMGLQADSTVHYLTGTDGSVFTSPADRAIDSQWNTYRYAGLPPGPISNPSLDAIMAAIYPEPNDNWYFLTTLDTGEVKYGRTLEEHNVNVQKFLR